MTPPRDSHRSVRGEVTSRWRCVVHAAAAAFLVLALPGPAAVAESPQMAVTIDDLPQNSRIRTREHHLAINERLLRTLTAAAVPAVGFVNASKCYERGELIAYQRQILAAWVEAGLELGNHTWSHPDYDHIDFEAFATDVERGEPLLRDLLAAAPQSPGRPLRWFRHPYLHRGDTDAKRERLEVYLRDRDYREAPVSIDNAEWVYAVAYDSTLIRGELEAARSIGASYVQYMLDMVRFWEDQAQQLFGRRIRHVLLIHANTLNADHLDELLTALERIGYDFVSLDTALADPAYATADRFTGRAGISWLHRWAITREVDPATFADEPEVPQWVRTTAGM